MPTVAADGLAFEYDERGDAAHPAILLVMGLGMQMVMWPERFCDLLAERGFRVIRFDNRDVGLSTKLDHLGTPNVPMEAVRYVLRRPLRAPYLIEDMARDTRSVLDALRIDRAHVVGASMGGMIAQNLAAGAPARVASVTSIMSTTGCRDLPSPTLRAWGALMAPPAKTGDFEGAVKRLMKVLRTIGSRTHPPEARYLRDLCERQVRRSYEPAGPARQLVAIAASGDRTDVVKRIAAPTLVLHGDEDPLLHPDCAEATAQAIRAGGGTARVEIVRGMGHDLPVPLFPQLVESIASHCRAHA
ncbi:MAG TPA: alpha/beta hydrolase [Usitatibacter sp.]|nr:alpha/beta hydrolase [Usitatibacter sp.]